MSNLSPQQFSVQIMPKDKYINVAMQMVPKSKASNTVSSTKA